MKRFLISGLVLGAVASGMAQTYILTGSPVGWAQPGSGGGELVMTNVGGTKYEATFTGLTAGTKYEFKTFANNGTPDWGGGFGDNTQIVATGTSIKVTLDTSAPADGWLPSSGHRIAYDMSGTETLEVVGSWDWSLGTTFALSETTPGIYETAWINGTFAPNTSYEFKFRTPGTWTQTNVGANFGNGGNFQYTTNAAWTVTKFIYDPKNGRVAMVPEPASMAVLGLGLAGLVARRKRK